MPRLDSTQPTDPSTNQRRAFWLVLALSLFLLAVPLAAAELDPADSRITRPGSGDYEWGEVLASGDFDADGFEDLVIADPSEGEQGAPSNGSILIFYGARDGQLFSLTLIGGGNGACAASPTAGLGTALAVGDFNGDGADDLAASMPGQDVTRADSSTADGAGTVVVFFGLAGGFLGDSTCLHLELPDLPVAALDGDAFGSALAAGDFDADGAADLAVGIPGRTIDAADDAGMVAVFYGDDSAPPHFDLPRTTTFQQGADGLGGLIEPGDRFGSSLTSGDFLGGDMAGCDLAVGAPGEDIGVDDAGAVHVLFGCFSGFGLTGTGSLILQAVDVTGVGPQAGREFGLTLAYGNLGNDEGPSLLIGAPGHDQSLPADGGDELFVDVGAVFVYSNDLTAATPRTLWSAADLYGAAGGYDDFHRLGASMAVGKVGRGPDHLMIGAPGTLDCGFTCEASEGRVLYVPGGDGWTVDAVSSRSQVISLHSPMAPEAPSPQDRLGAGLTFCDLGGGVQAVIGIPGSQDPESFERLGALWLVQSEILFDDGFESGDFSHWSSFTE